MNPHLALHDDVDVMDLSPLIRGMVLTLRYTDEEHGVVGNWHIFLNLIDLEARKGCDLTHLTGIIYGLDESDRHDPFHSSVRSAFKLNVIRPLCWLGLLREDREGLGFLEDGTLVRSPLWSASLKLESDNQPALRRIRSRGP